MLEIYKTIIELCDGALSVNLSESAFSIKTGKALEIEERIEEFVEELYDSDDRYLAAQTSLLDDQGASPYTILIELKSYAEKELSKLKKDNTMVEQELCYYNYTVTNNSTGFVAHGRRFTSETEETCKDPKIEVYTHGGQEFTREITSFSKLD
jgi:hypothetical protein